MSSFAGFAEPEPARETLQRACKLAKRRASPCFTTRQKGTKVLLLVVELCQIDIGDTRDREACRSCSNFVRERFSIGVGEPANLLVAGEQCVGEVEARLLGPAPVVDTDGEVVGEAASGR